jgi:hypothetical protein
MDTMNPVALSGSLNPATLAVILTTVLANVVSALGRMFVGVWGDSWPQLAGMSKENQIMKTIDFVTGELPSPS